MSEKENGSLAWARESTPASCEAVADLYLWSSNFEKFEPFRKFLGLIGYLEGESGEGFIGFLELSKVASALQVYSERPSEVKDFISELLEVEVEFGL